MEEIYLIKTNPSDYDSSPWTIGFVLDEETARLVVEQEKTNYQLAQMIVSSMAIQREFFTETLLRPELEAEEQWPKWASGICQKDITQAMRDERDGIKAENKAKSLRNQAKDNAYYKIIHDYIAGQLEKELAKRGNAKRYIYDVSSGGYVSLVSLCNEEPFTIKRVKQIKYLPLHHH